MECGLCEGLPFGADKVQGVAVGVTGGGGWRTRPSEELRAREASI